MTTRTASFGIAALVVGIALLVVTDGAVLTGVGVALLVAGLGVVAAAGLLGLRTRDPVQAAAAAEGQAAANDAELRRASETGRWPRVIGGG